MTEIDILTVLRDAAGDADDDCKDPSNPHRISHSDSGALRSIFSRAADEIESLRADNEVLYGYANHRMDCGLVLAAPSEEGTAMVVAPCTCRLDGLMDKWRGQYLAKAFATQTGGSHE